MIDGLFDRVGEIDSVWLLVLAFFLPYGETVALLDFVVPGEVGMVLLGAVAAETDTSLLAVIALGSAGAFLGDSTSWYIGHRWGTSVIERWEPVARRLSPMLASAEDYFARRGGLAILGGRFVGGLRAVVPLVAGTAGMPYRQFWPWNLAASLTWVTAIVTLGHLFGRRVATIVDRAGPILTGVVLVAAALWWARRRWRRRDQT